MFGARVAFGLFFGGLWPRQYSIQHGYIANFQSLQRAKGPLGPLLPKTLISITRVEYRIHFIEVVIILHTPYIYIYIYIYGLILAPAEGQGPFGLLSIIGGIPYIGASISYVILYIELFIIYGVLDFQVFIIYWILYSLVYTTY